MTGLIPLAISALVSILGSGVLGAWLMHRRLSPKSRAEASEITAAAMDKDWARFHREIDRLVKRLEEAEDRAASAERRERECEARAIDCERHFAETEAALKAKIIQLETYHATIGQVHQEAASIVAADRLEQKRAGQ